MTCDRLNVFWRITCVLRHSELCPEYLQKHDMRHCIMNNNFIKYGTIDKLGHLRMRHGENGSCHLLINQLVEVSVQW